AADLVKAIALLRLPAVDHHVAEQIEVARALPPLWMHDNRAIKADHFVGRWRPGRLRELIVAGNHVAPPGLFDIPLQLDAQRAVVPEAVQPAVDLTRLKQKPAAAAEGN